MSEPNDERWEKMDHVERFRVIAETFDSVSKSLKNAGAPPSVWFDMCAVAVVYMLKISPRGTPKAAYERIENLRQRYQAAMVVGDELTKLRKSRS